MADVAIDRQYIGLRLPPVSVPVDAQQLRQFHEAIGSVGASVDPTIAPPTYLKVIEGTGNSSRTILSALGVDLRRVMHVEQEFEYREPIRIGDFLTVERTVRDISVKKGGALEFVVVESTIHNRDGSLVGQSRQWILVRNEPRVASVTSAPPDTRIVGTIVADRTFSPIGHEDLRRYANASGDSNPLHLDPQFAREAGFEDVIVHGMLGMALLGRLLTEGPFQSPLLSFRARFRGIIRTGEPIRCCAHLLAQNDPGTDLALEARNPAGTLLIEGKATVARATGS